METAWRGAARPEFQVRVVENLDDKFLGPVFLVAGSGIKWLVC